MPQLQIRRSASLIESIVHLCYRPPVYPDHPVSGDTVQQRSDGFVVLAKNKAMLLPEILVADAFVVSGIAYRKSMRGNDHETRLYLSDRLRRARIVCAQQVTVQRTQHDLQRNQHGTQAVFAWRGCNHKRTGKNLAGGIVVCQHDIPNSCIALA